MRKAERWPMALLVGILSVLAGGRAALAAPCKTDPTVLCPLEYHGGPILEKFKIYPLYYGVWTQAEIDEWQAYIVTVAAYMSGAAAPPFTQPMMKQYGVDQVTVAAPKRASPNAAPGAKPTALYPSGPILSREFLLQVIADNQASKKLPDFGPNTLILVLPGDGFTVSGTGSACGEGGGCHPSESITQFWAVVPKSQKTGVIAHEIFEASTDPVKATAEGWDEAVDGCSGIIYPFAGIDTFSIPPATDNTNGGACSTTGYTSLDEKQDYEVTSEQFLTDYNLFHFQGWRLYILQSYTLANGDVRYNAVWRPGPLDFTLSAESLMRNETHDQFVAANKTASAEGWKLYILQSYVLADGEVRYNAVWRRGTLNEKVLIGITSEQFLADYYKFHFQGWRLYILQSYVLANGDVRYNAVWRPGPLDEAVSTESLLPNATRDQFLAKNAAVSAQGGWNLYILQSYVLADGEKRYNAVWRGGTTYEHRAVYGSTYSDYRAKYDKLFPEGWRLYILNAYVLPSGGVRYDAVWRLGTIDRPL
jgi:hypothetical protein